MERNFVHPMDIKLYSSSCRGDLEGVKSALMHGGRVGIRKNGRSPLLVAAWNGHTDICRLLLAHGSFSSINERDSEGNTPLSVAVQKRHRAICELLLAHGALPETENSYNLQFAAKNGDEDIIASLISCGADVNLEGSEGGWTPLSVACEHGHLSCVHTLLKAGANITPRSGKDLPINVAAKHNREEIVRILLEHGCSPDTVCINVFALTPPST